ncbi:hypothetical protein [Cryptosporangium aurantiacum]|uniref:Uncharacterized protein n=1 Tax=Cryptosporangium aurantiacum TaxID=134849 RepID=A0A1M7RKU5_9ACTN|nr:hypothetical protein [Cryptosporangium aurantiacum]SHN46965.1 hypothetical protein SAMN05443668_11961 [Cryptosporangium aurantiacum]
MRSLAVAMYVVCVGALLLVAALFLPRSRSVDFLSGQQSDRPDGVEGGLLVLAAVVAVALAVLGSVRSRPWLVVAAAVPGLVVAGLWLWYVFDLRNGNRDIQSCTDAFACTDLLIVRPAAGAYLMVAGGLVIALGGALALRSRR